FLVIMLAVVMALSVVSIVACRQPSDRQPSVRLALYVTENGSPKACTHIIGNDDLPVVTNGTLTFDGWYYDKAYTKPFSVSDTGIEDGTPLYAKWTTSTSANKVTVTLNPNYTGASVQTFEIDKNSTFALPNWTRTGYTFAGWFTEPVNGMQWTNTLPFSSDTTLYAHWTNGSGSGGNNNENLTPVDLSSVFSKYNDYSKFNFAIKVTLSDGSDSYSEDYEYLGDYIKYMYEDYYGDNVDYLVYEDGTYYYYVDAGDGSYTKYDQTTSEFDEYASYMAIVDLTQLGSNDFGETNGYYTAINPSSTGNAVLGEYDSTYTSVTLYITNDNISKIIAVSDDGYTMTYEFSKFGSINFTIPDATEGGTSGGGSGDPLPTEPTGTMDNQIYDADNFDNSNLQEKMKETDGSIGLPSTGKYNALVIPVQFQNDNISPEQLANLEKAFNGTSTDTGWESVHSYYYKSSYGKLDITFDITSVFQASQTSSYYSGKSEQVTTSAGNWTKDGSAFILEEALNWCITQGIDLSKYDTNGDGCIDAVYLIYSESVDYDEADFFWAYVTWYYGDEDFSGNNQSDELYAYYYLFAGFDFMDEKVKGKTDEQYYPSIDGLIINAETFIHETGHLLGLDDYYDYSKGTGGDLGLGGADMMDNNVGDHGVYSKIMLGWLDPTIVTSTQTITIKSSQDGGYAILIPLNWNNSYFCEYLLIDLYTATGLNEMGANQDDSILYGGARYGVRIYHVSSSINDPYSDNYGSFTDYNNSNSNIPLIKLIEADGKTTTSSTNYGAWASEEDLWKEGQSFNDVFPQYMRNDGKTLNFNITIDSVSAESATITVTYNTAA
ncbi:MAG: InlB B-repeat-containing protein, partial [Clostridia bacterium]|nr:InlB B-repeat-containing protein [Clostridia bacterium]